MKNIHTLFILACLCAFQKAYSDTTISFYFQPYPYTQESTANRLAKPGKIAKHILEGITNHNPVTGIFASYAGYLDVSNTNGLIMFPRKHENPALHLVISHKIIPIAMMSNTIHHWELDKDTPADIFLVERTQDPATKLFYLKVTKEQRPKDNIIPLESLIIIAKPDKVEIPLGITLTQDQPNLVLPDIYIKKGLNYTGNALFMVKISHLFAPVKTTYKKEEKRYLSHIAN